MKVALALLAAVLFLAGTARADGGTVIIDVTATPSTQNCESNCLLASFNAQFTAVPETIPFYGNVLEVTGITGTFDGEFPMTFVAPQDSGGYSDVLGCFCEGWVENGMGYEPFGMVYFQAGGEIFRLYNDDTGNLLENLSTGPMTYIGWNASDPPPMNTPEPGAALLLGCGLLSLLGLVRAKSAA